VKFDETARRRWLSLKMNSGRDQAVRPLALDAISNNGICTNDSSAVCSISNN
jgi:hypothetical protein